MKWFKHLSNSQNDEVLSELITEFGAEGYGIWWIILEKIAAQIDQKGITSVRYSAKKWANFCEVSVKKFRKVVNLLEKKMPNLVVIDDGQYVQINCPNILKFCDEWTQRRIRELHKSHKLLGSNPRASSEKTQHEVEVEVEVEEEEEKEKEKEKEKNARKSSSSFLFFELFWNAFDDKRGEKPAIKSWQKIPNLTDALGHKIIEGAKQYAIERKTILAKSGTPKMAEGWLADQRWKDEFPAEKDWKEDARAKLREKEKELNDEI